MTHARVIGFTGTQKGMSDAQCESLYQVLCHLNGTTFVHGDCVGADEQAYDIVALGSLMWTVARPCTIAAKRANTKSDEIHPPKPPLERNHDIVDQCHVLIACPDGPERQRSGTWATVRYAIKQGKPIVVVYPRGEIARPQTKLL